MREYKFRGKRVDNGEWVYGNYFIDERDIEDGFIWRDIPQIQQRYGDHYQYYDVDPSTVGQYTGLPDKNGNELWESDIIENEHKERYLIVWDGTGFKVALNGSKKAIYSVNEYWFKSCKKIGNKWDNPELLKEVE